MVPATALPDQRPAFVARRGVRVDLPVWALPSRGGIGFPALRIFYLWCLDNYPGRPRYGRSRPSGPLACTFDGLCHFGASCPGGVFTAVHSLRRPGSDVLVLRLPVGFRVSVAARLRPMGRLGRLVGRLVLRGGLGWTSSLRSLPRPAPSWSVLWCGVSAIQALQTRWSPTHLGNGSLSVDAVWFLCGGSLPVRSCLQVVT
mmetsp:Transcript_30431/g.69431  ORF Transcript_30431/g.69431 Transcript_30431/m.69431 type:complete len:201 (-) Transcript_30431:5177-5779(-)